MLACLFSLWHLACSAFAYNIKSVSAQAGTRGKHIKLNVMLGSAQPNVMCDVQGIKITDADSKKKAVKLLKAEQAMRQMDIDSDASDSGSDVEMK